MSTPVPGWYPAPDRVGQMRYWDGVQWTDRYQAQDVVTPVARPASLRQDEQWWPAPTTESAVASSAGWESSVSKVYAGFWARAGASVVDSIIVYASAFVLYATLGSLIYAIYGDVGDTTIFIVIDLIVYPLYFGLHWWYYTTGWSPGRALVGLRIVDEQGDPPGARRGIGRLLMSVVSTLVLGIGYLAMLWSPKKQTWHDAAAGTYVVRVR